MTNLNKTMTLDNFTSILVNTKNLPITIDKAVSTGDNVPEWKLDASTSGQDMLTYGIYSLNYALQSLVGTATNALVKREKAFIKLAGKVSGIQKEKIDNAIAYYNSSYSSAFNLFEIIKAEQVEQLIENGFYDREVDAFDLDEEEWNPQEWKPFSVELDKLESQLKAKKFPASAIKKRMELEQDIAARVEEAFNNETETELSEDIIFKTAVKIHNKLDMYYEKCKAKEVEHMESANDNLSDDSNLRAEYLAQALKMNFKVIQSCPDIISVH